MIWAALSASKAFRPLVCVLAVLGTLVGVFWAGTAWERRGATIEALKTDQQTGERIDAVQIPSDPDAIDDGLRGHAGE